MPSRRFAYLPRRTAASAIARFIDDRSHSVSGRFSISATRGQHHVPSSFENGGKFDLSPALAGGC